MTPEQKRNLQNALNRLFNQTMAMSGPGQLNLDKLATYEQRVFDCVEEMLAASDAPAPLDWEALEEEYGQHG